MKKTTYILALVIFLLLVIFSSVHFGKSDKQALQHTVPAGSGSLTSVLDTVSASWVGSAKEYISSHYPDYAVVQVTPDPMCTGEDAVDVSIENGSDTRSLIFLLNGDFAQSEVDKAFGSADVQLLKILKEKYASYTYGDRYESLTMANGENRYLVDLSPDNGKTTSELILNTKGEVLCQTKAK